MTVHFDLFCPDAMIETAGCPWRHLNVPDPGCRGCAISQAVYRAMETGTLQVTVTDGYLHPEFQVFGRRFHGTYSDDAARLAIHRTIAWLHGHRDPLELMTADALR